MAIYLSHASNKGNVGVGDLEDSLSGGGTSRKLGGRHNVNLEVAELLAQLSLQRRGSVRHDDA